jgi:hypothetical protein
MKKNEKIISRRSFIKATTAITAVATVAVPLISESKEIFEKDDEVGINILGPIKGFSPHVGSLASMMDWMRASVIGSVRNMTVTQLDYLHDADLFGLQ